MEPLKSKTGLEVANPLEKIFKERKPDKLWVDMGREFYNKEVQKLVTLYSTENEEKSSVVERWNRTMKEKCLSIFLRIPPRDISMFWMNLLSGIIIQNTPL